MTVLTRMQVRALDRIALERFGIPGIVLMENAGRGAADSLARALAPRGDRIGIVCGRGNNGGDGFVMARHLRIRGEEPIVILLGEQAAFRGAGEAGVNFRILERMGLEIRSITDPAELPRALEPLDIVVDAILGTGLTGEVRGMARAAVSAVNALRSSRVFAVDIPSGLDCDSGVPLGAAVRACATATFASLKRGFLQPGAAEFTGMVEVVDIGCPMVWE